MCADYAVMLRIKWPCFLPKIVKIRAALLNLLAEMRGPVYLGPPCIFITRSAASQNGLWIDYVHFKFLSTRFTKKGP